jgi:HK97 family phage prohead protease
MERKSFKFEIKSVDEEGGTFEGIASAYRKKADKVGDIVDPGAFTKTIKESGGKTLITYPPHNIDSIVGDGDIEDTPKGLKITGSILRELSKGNDAYLLLKRGVIKTLSIGYEVIKQEVVDGISI